MNRHHRRWLAVLALSACFGSGVALRATDADSRTEAALKNSYAFKHYLKDDDITVKSSKGVVTLGGTVAEDYHRSLAEDTASSMPGVARVENRISVRTDQPAARSDAWITLKVKGALAFHRSVSALATEVTTDNGVVTLSGQAGSAAEKELATEYAKAVEGVKSVRNDMRVTGKSDAALPVTERIADEVDDASITAQVKTSLLFNRATRALATRVATRNGVVTIRGDARNPAEKQLVGKLAMDVRGVRKVENQMRVE
jgi:osmotically-inducible protein OsmY